MNIFLVSRTRTGSSWLCKLLLEITGYDHARHYGKHKIANLNPSDGDNLLRKSHVGNFKNVWKKFKPINYKTVTIVRNPRDSYLSACRHDKINPNTNLAHYKARARGIKDGMIPYHSTDGISPDYPYYIWTAYEWLMQDTFMELRKILDFLGMTAVPMNKILDAISIWDNKNVSIERDMKKFGHADITIAKNKWKDSFTPDMIENTQPQYDEYMEALREERK